MPVPAHPKLYHIVHRDRLPSIAQDGHLLADSRMGGRAGAGTIIGMSSIKARRLTELQLESHPGLLVGQCVPFYFCPRSVMLYLIHQANHVELSYRGGQEPIVHLELDLLDVVHWANANGVRWAFTLSNAGSRYFDDRADLARLTDVNWDAVAARKWSGPGISSSVKEGKQAEFLVEDRVPWQLVQRIGVRNAVCAQLVADSLRAAGRHPPVNILPDWYY